MAVAVPKVLILGHSFVKRLKCDLKASFDARADSSFHLEGTNTASLFGVGSRTVQKLRQYDLHMVRRLAPDVVILEIGTSDLSVLGPEVIGSSIEELVHSLLDDFSASKQPASKKQRRAPRTSTPTSEAGEAPLAPTPATDTPMANTVPTAFPPELIDQLVNRVADEVSRRMSSTGGGSQAAISQPPSQIIPPPSSDVLTEIPFTDVARLPATGSSTSLIEGSIAASRWNLTGETAP
ncbi:hypothetical protein OS493_036119 [Desmophyllum pertusum]|uniref:Uncharacterized protein n=1 Tax=Desmophyllum pertusum TaxID=174260 RepID=A0A9W9YAJ0_9CNID|nr:hypothetical protein OS493_036119 [Desmophyllum pertusum]